MELTNSQSVKEKLDEFVNPKEQEITEDIVDEVDTDEVEEVEKVEEEKPKKKKSKKTV